MNPLYPGEPNSRTTTDILWGTAWNPKQPFIRQDLITNDLNYVAPLSTSATIDRDYISKRPRIAIVTLVTSVWGHSYGVEEMGLQCYSATHGYDHHVDMVYLQPDRHFFSGRFRTALKYLPYYDYIVHASLDIFPANRSRRIEDIPGFGADVLIPNRNFYYHWRCSDCEFPYIQPSLVSLCPWALFDLALHIGISHGRIQSIRIQSLLLSRIVRLARSSYRH